MTRQASASAHRSLQDIREAVLRITAAHGVRNVRLFGSFARGEQRDSNRSHPGGFILLRGCDVGHIRA